MKCWLVNYWILIMTIFRIPQFLGVVVFPNPPGWLAFLGWKQKISQLNEVREVRWGKYPQTKTKSSHWKHRGWKMMCFFCKGFAGAKCLLLRVSPWKYDTMEATIYKSSRWRFHRFVAYRCPIQNLIKYVVPWAANNPRCSMYGIFAHIWHKFMVNVGKYSIH